MNKDVFHLGMTATEVVAVIVKQHPKIKALAFYAYEPMANISEMPSDPSLSQLLSHDSATGKEVWLKREEITPDNLYKMIGGLKEDYVLSVLSKVVFKHRKIFHVPMMDFSEGSSLEQSHNLARIVYFLEQAGYGNGVVLFSGRSFHYYGNFLMSDQEYRSFMYDCLLSGVAEPRYIAHRGKDGYGVLRLSDCALRPHIPNVVSILD